MVNNSINKTISRHMLILRRLQSVSHAPIISTLITRRSTDREIPVVMQAFLISNLIGSDEKYLHL